MINPPEIGFLTSSTRLEDPSKAMKKKKRINRPWLMKKRNGYTEKVMICYLISFRKKTDELGVHENPGASH